MDQLIPAPLMSQQADVTASPAPQAAGQRAPTATASAPAATESGVAAPPGSSGENIVIPSDQLGQLQPDGRYLLLRDQIDDVYFNEWEGVLLGNAHDGQAEVHIWGEGQALEFSGDLSLNCEPGGREYWEPATNERSSVLKDGELDDPVVPKEVNVEARKLFCPTVMK